MNFYVERNNGVTIPIQYCGPEVGLRREFESLMKRFRPLSKRNRGTHGVGQWN
jgi:hypothetical protein